MPKLIIKSGERKGHVVRVKNEKVSIGRDPTNTLVLPDRRVSRFHATIEPLGEKCLINDLGSVNGVWINNTRISKQALKIGDEITVGSTLLGFASMDTPDHGCGDHAPQTQVRILPEEETQTSIQIEKAVFSENVEHIKEELNRAEGDGIPKAYERLITLYRISNELGTVVDLSKLLDRILELVLDTMKADRGFIMLKDSETGELILKAVQQKKDVAKDEISISRTITEQVLTTGESILTTDAMADNRFKQAMSIMLHHIHSTMCAPIKLKDKLLGIMHVDTKSKIVQFTKEDLELLTAICNQAAVAIENAVLFEDLKKANQELKDQQAQLIESEKLSALGKLAGGVAHEINNPMTCILGYSELVMNRLIQGNLGEDEAKQCAEDIKIVNDEAHRCEQIVQTLLQFGRRKKDEMKLYDVNAVVAVALKIAQFHIKKVRIDIKEDLADNLPQIMADVNQLQQVFLNFIINARDAMEEGGTLTIITQEPDKGWVEIRFQDTGCGIPEDKMEEIFKPLFTTKEEGKGTGLGLSVSQDIIERHQGMIDVESTVGKGTTFIVKLPAGESAVHNRSEK